MRVIFSRNYNVIFFQSQCTCECKFMPRVHVAVFVFVFILMFIIMLMLMFMLVPIPGTRAVDTLAWLYADRRELVESRQLLEYSARCKVREPFSGTRAETDDGLMVE